ncbi:MULTISPECIES: hypothetical protein [Mesonia]|uniref:Uncharacterized protein n=1 Tax=Mesonia oceanica TaxID=2687242 RepID=A0AC61Y819_9FLAO|nr:MULTISPECIES: hypothetical protein [Mesonia]MAN26625.1 hypothetical protein [Mesonia sp.]MAQ40893.1 hypothetical protein [Mesonia sp.]MBJ97814.1 hypothetical protein [Flavobacteriaceae bacterium]VVU99524.1 hypothetical protein FVB9532_00778 [Mesonia oceanica]|tara:strand:- start:98 stop:559 length:462 start_codon:yes stop_codon:yes gene_type:complete
MKRDFWVIILIIFIFGCSVQKGLKKENIIPYRFPSNVEQLLLKQIEENPKEDYCLLMEGTEKETKIYLVKGYNFYHKKTSYRGLIGEKYYPISFLQFDIQYGVTENAKKLLQRKINSKNSSEFLTQKSYPLYHDMYKIEFDRQRNIIFEGYVY